MLKLLYGLGFIFYNLQSVKAQYFGYDRRSFGDPESVVFDTASSPADVSTTIPPPDVFLNATVHVTEIDLTVSNITAKINLDAQVLQLLKFNAGVDLSIDRVALLIQDVDAHVVLEARLANLVRMISNVLDSLDLNPILATLGNELGDLVGDTVGELAGADGGTLVPRSFELEQNILYAVNDYTGNTHTNRVLAQNGDIVAQSLHNDGRIYAESVVGFYAQDMDFNGHNETVTRDGNDLRELEYVYTPFPGLRVVSLIYTNAVGDVVETQVISEAHAGGSSTVDGEPLA